MAAYAALLSVSHIIERINQPPPPPNSLHKIQLLSLSQNVCFLQDFLERYQHDGSEEADELESRIRDVAHAAEDVIESHIVDQIAAGSTTSTHAQEISSIDLYEGLEKVIQDMAFIKEEVMVVQEKRRIINIQINTNSSIPSDSLRSTFMVGFDDLLYEIMDKLIGGQLDRQIIPVSGMGGTGKTTLAKNIFEHKTIVQHFNILAWATISQEYSARDILLEIIGQENTSEDLSEGELGEVVYKHLWGRRYLIVMDDMWVLDVWNKVNRFFPNNNNGSRILITTRLLNVALQLTKTHGLKMRFLNEDESWDLLCKNIFEEDGCPLELEETGRMIANHCKGLPLSIVVIARVLAKSAKTQEYWEYIAENTSSIVNLEDDERCLKLLSTSYNQLPVYLKSCFLYMGVFKEDRLIRISLLLKLWVVEGFLKPISGKILKAVAQGYLHDLIDRNLIFIHESEWRIKYCSTHDLLRDLCLRQAQREKFISVTSQSDPHILQGISTHRRIVIRRRTCNQAIQSSQSTPLVRSLICDFDDDLPSQLDFRLLRVLLASDENFDIKKAEFLDSLEAIFSRLINSRYLAITIDKSWIPDSQLLPSSLYLLWNVHTLIILHDGDLIAPLEIWKMPQLQHVEFSSLKLQVPLIDEQDDIVLANLQTLSTIKNFNCCEEVIKKIPNIKRLEVRYDGIEGWSFSCFDNLHHLKLETLDCSFSSNFENPSDLLQNYTFPYSIRKLNLYGCKLHWEDITTKIGSLSVLEVLKLGWKSTRGHEWETIEGGFLKLKFLAIYWSDLECWISDSMHFPVLECLNLFQLEKLENIPLDLGNISTLKLIDISFCRDSAVFSAKEILDEQEDLGNEDLQIRVLLNDNNKELKSFKSRNFKIS